MINKRYLLSEALDSIFLFDLLAKNVSRESLIVLTYHSVCNKQRCSLFDEELRTTPRDFERQLKFIRKYFSVITLKELYQHCICSSELPRKPVMITFDDGYKDNYYNAFRILQKYDLKATFFVSTDYIENRNVFWWDQIAYIVKSSERKTIRLLYPREKKYNTVTREAKSIAIRELQRLVKTTQNLDLKLFVDGLASSTGINMKNNSRTGDEMLLTWSDIKEMKKAGMGIGSHTKTHRVLSTLPDTKLEEELSDSRGVLEYHLGEPVYALSYPVGGANSFNKKVQEFAKRCGYALAFSYRTGVNILGTVDLFNLKRLGVDGVSLPYFKAIMTMPSQFVYK